MSNELKIILGGLMKFLVGAAMSFAAIQLYLYSGSHHLATESWIEIGQETCLLFSGLVFAYAAYRRPDLRGGLVLIMGFLFSLLIREFDGYFDDIVHGFWKYILIVFLCGIAYAVVRAGRQTVLLGLAHFISSRSFLWMLAGTVIVLVYSRLYGMKSLWIFFSSGCEGWQKAKSFGEEATEFLGYVFIVLAGIQYLAELAREAKARLTK